MSFKTVSKILPVISNSLKGSNLLQKPLLSFQIKNAPLGIANLCNQIDLRGYSTKPRPKFEEVYYGALTPQIKAVKIFSLTSSIVGIACQPILYKELVSTGNVPVILAGYSVIGFFTFVTPILLHLITKKYVTHVTYNEEKDTYTARTVNFFCITKQTEFKPEQVVVPEIPGMFTSFEVNGKGFFIEPKLFEYPEHYARIMGFDKPIDFKLSEPPLEEPEVNKKPSS